MSCGCQDKENDAKIIEEVQRRKNMNELPMTNTYEDFLFTGTLQFACSFVDESEIVSIDRRDDTWIFHLKKNQLEPLK